MDRTAEPPTGTADATQGADRQGAATGRAMTDGPASEWATTDGAPDIETTHGEIAARLDRIEAAAAERGIDARVVDVGDGTLLLHLKEPPDYLEHGQRLRVRLPDGPASETTDDQPGQDP